MRSPLRSSVTTVMACSQFERDSSYARAVRAAFEALGCTILSRPDAHSVTSSPRIRRMVSMPPHRSRRCASARCGDFVARRAHGKSCASARWAMSRRMHARCDRRARTRARRSWRTYRLHRWQRREIIHGKAAAPLLAQITNGDGGSKATARPREPRDDRFDHAVDLGIGSTKYGANLDWWKPLRMSGESGK